MTKKPTLHYRDITHHPDAESLICPAPELRDALIQLGFNQVSLLEIRAPELADQIKQLPLFMDRSDADTLINASQGSIDEVLASPDRQAFAVVDPYFGGAVIVFYTIMQNGVVVETVMKPKRGPAPGNTVLGAPSKGAEVTLQATTKIMQFAMGKPPLWPHADAPQAGYHVALLDTEDVGTLWQHHQQRVQTISQAKPAAIRPHTSLPLYLCILQRAHQIMEYKAKWQGGLMAGITILMLLAIIALPLAFFLAGDTLQAYLNTIVNNTSHFIIPLIVILPAFIIISLALLALRLVKTWLVPRLPGPALQPVSELLQEIPKLTTSTAPLAIQGSAQPEATSSPAQRPSSKQLSPKVIMITKILYGVALSFVIAPNHKLEVAELSIGQKTSLIGIAAVQGMFMSWLFMGSDMSLKAKLFMGALLGISVSVVTMLIAPLNMGIAFYYGVRIMVGALAVAVVDYIAQAWS